MIEPTAPRVMVNALTIDVEDYFQVSAFAGRIARDSWESMPCRVERNVERILEMLAERDVRATFFVLGWVAERYPGLVRKLASGGHEIASHGYEHKRVTDQAYGSFLADIRLAKAILEDVSQKKVSGYRAPSFSVGPGNEWAFDCMLEAGYRYSSSVYPIRHDHYGVPDAPRFAYEVRPGLLEVPVATVRLLNANWPAGGGGYFRLLPYGVSRWSLRRVNERDGEPAIFYFHPWELDPEQPRVDGINFRTRFRHYLNLRHMASRMRELLGDFRWSRIDEIFLGTPA